MTTAAPRPSVFERQLHFVSGKGGVGKSSVAVALATSFADDGLATLLCQVNAQDSHGALLGVDVVDETLRQASKNLTVVNIRPDAALHEYAKLILKLDTLVDAILENRVARAFLRFIPALAELTMLGKIWFHAEETKNERRRFDRIVVDAPSTGHGLGFLRVARVVHDATAGLGPMAEKTREMQRTLTDPTRTAVHVVTLPEELPVNETIELVHALRDEALPPIGTVMVNMMTPSLFAPDDAPLLQRVASECHKLDSSSTTAVGLRPLLQRHEQEAREKVEWERLANAVPDIQMIPIALRRGDDLRSLRAKMQADIFSTDGAPSSGATS